MAKKIKTKDLGKGIGALLSSFDTGRSSKEETQEVVKELTHSVANIPLEAVKVNPFQPRVEFEEQALEELANSIKVHGLIQPITVRRLSEGEYQLISGERRLRASKLAGLTDIPAYIRLANDQEMLEMALVENIQREELNPIEIAHTYQRLIEECSLTHEALAKRVGKGRALITNYLRLLKLPPDIKLALKSKEITKGHAMALAKVENVDHQLEMLRQVKNLKLSVRATEAMADRFLSGHTKSAKLAAPALPLEYEKVRQSLSSHLGAKVDMKVAKKGNGQIIIKFSSTKDLNRLLDILED